MSTTSTVITIIICALLVVAIGYALVKGIWSVSKKITLPIQVALFIVMLVCVVRLFCTKENAQKLYKGIEETGISQNVENTMRSALNLEPAETSKPEAEPTQVTAAPAAPEPPPAPVAAPAATEPPPAPVAAPTVVENPNPAPNTKAVQGSETVKADSQAVEAPAVANVEAKETPAPQPVAAPAPQPVAAPEPAPVKVPDYSHLDKGKKTFTYALPFNAKVTVGFKDNTYRVLAESIGRLDNSEKKEIGNLILTSLGKYVGKTIERPDKSKISIESHYDESANHTRVFAIIQPDAIE